MLNTLRHAVKSWVAKVLIGLLIASFAVWGIGDMFSFRLESAVAEVGETEVSAERFAEALQREQQRLSRESGELVPFSTVRLLGLDRRVLARMIRDAAFEEEMRVTGLAAPDEAVAEAIRSDPDLAGPSGQFSPETYRFLLSRQGFSAAEFEELTRELIGQRLIAGAIAAATAPPGAATRIAAYRGETRDIATAVLPSEAADAPAEPDDATLQAFYEANAALYTEPERRSGRYLHVDPAMLAAENQPSDDAVAAAYEAEKALYTTPGTRTIEQIIMADAAAAEAALARITAGEISFDELATEMGLAPADVALGTVTASDLPEVSAGPIFAATEPSVIGPVPTPLGSSIVRITAVEEGGTQPFEAVKDRVATRLATEAALSATPDIANRIDEGRAAGKALDEIALEVRLPLGSFDGLGRDASLADGSKAEGFAASEVFLTEVFEALDLEERPVIDTPDGGFLVVMVDRVDPEHLVAFDEVADRVRADWTAEARLALLDTEAKALAERLGRGDSLDDIAAERGLEVERHAGVDRFRDDPALPRDLVARLFELPKGDAASARAATGAGVILAQVETITAAPPEALAAASGNVEQVLANSLAGDQLEYFSRAAEARHGTRTYPGVVEQVFRLLGGDSGDSGDS